MGSVRPKNHTKAPRYHHEKRYKHIRNRITPVQVTTYKNYLNSQLREILQLDPPTEEECSYFESEFIDDVFWSRREKALFFRKLYKFHSRGCDLTILRGDLPNKSDEEILHYYTLLQKGLQEGKQNREKFLELMTWEQMPFALEMPPELIALEEAMSFKVLKHEDHYYSRSTKSHTKSTIESPPSPPPDESTVIRKKSLDRMAEFYLRHFYQYGTASMSQRSNLLVSNELHLQLEQLIKSYIRRFIKAQIIQSMNQTNLATRIYDEQRNQLQIKVSLRDIHNFFLSQGKRGANLGIKWRNWELKKNPTTVATADNEVLVEKEKGKEKEEESEESEEDVDDGLEENDIKSHIAKRDPSELRTLRSGFVVRDWDHVYDFSKAVRDNLDMKHSTNEILKNTKEHVEYSVTSLEHLLAKEISSPSSEDNGTTGEEEEKEDVKQQVEQVVILGQPSESYDTELQLRLIAQETHTTTITDHIATYAKLIPMHMSQAYGIHTQEELATIMTDEWVLKHHYDPLRFGSAYYYNKATSRKYKALMDKLGLMDQLGLKEENQWGKMKEWQWRLLLRELHQLFELENNSKLYYETFEGIEVMDAGDDMDQEMLESAPSSSSSSPANLDTNNIINNNNDIDDDDHDDNDNDDEEPEGQKRRLNIVLQKEYISQETNQSLTVESIQQHNLQFADYSQDFQMDSLNSSQNPGSVVWREIWKEVQRGDYTWRLRQ